MTQNLNSESDASKEPGAPDSDDTTWGGSEGRFAALASLRIPNFRWLLSGSIFSNGASWIQSITLSWLVYNLTGSGTILGTINVVRPIASVCIIPIVGLLVDRLNRRKLIIFQNSWLFTITFLLGLMVLSHHAGIWLIFVFAFMGGMMMPLDMTLRQVLIFDLVPRSRVSNAIALIQTGWSIMRVIGPSIGGFLLIWISAGGNFLLQAGIYALVAITILRIKFPPPKEPKEVTRNSPLQNIKEGLRHAGKERVTRTFMLMGIIMPLLSTPIFSVLPAIYAVKVFGDQTGRVLGLLMASIGVGGIIGGVVAASISRFEYRGRLQLLALLFLALSQMGLAFSSHLALAMLCMCSAGFFELIFMVSNQTMLQLSIPDNLRGRVTAVINLSSYVMPIGSMIAGAGADLFRGPKMITIILTSVSALVAILVFIFSSTVRNYRMSQHLASNTKLSGS